MALKRKITQAEFDKLPADIKAEYVAKGDDYLLDVDGGDTAGGDDVGALRRAKDREVQGRKEAEAKAKDLETKLAELDTSDARKRGDIEALEKSWKQKLDDEKAGRKADKAKSDEFMSRTLIDNVADKLAGEISTSPALITPHIRGRLTADLTGDAPVTRILGPDGKVSAMTIEDLTKEIVDNKDFAPIIRATKASGGSAPQTGQRTRLGSASQTSTGEKPVMLSALDPADLAAQIKASKQTED